MKTTLPTVLETKLADFRRRVWAVKLAEALLAAVFGIALSYLLVFVLDRFTETPSAVRVALLLCVAIGVAAGLPLKWYRWVWRQRRLEDAARLLRLKFPRLGDQLLGLVELAKEDAASAGRSERLVQAAMAQAADAVRDQDFTQAVPHARHRRWGFAALGAVVLIFAAFLLADEAAYNALARWITPWLNIERYTFARIEPLPKRLVVPYAETFDVTLQLARDTRQEPAQAFGRIERQPGVTAGLAKGVYPLSFPPQKQDASLALSVGDVRKAVLIQPRPRPELTDIAVRLRLPAYLGYQSEQRIEAHSGTVSLLKGAEAAFDAKASRDLASAELDGRPQKIDGPRITTAFLPVAADAERKFTWKDQDGLTPRDPLTLRIHAADDEPPKIVARRESQEQVVLDSEVVTFELAASDDFGVKAVGLEWTGAEAPLGAAPAKGEKVASAGAPEKRELSAVATFCAAREGVAPQTLELRAWAKDYLPGRHPTRSAAFVLHVLNKTDHALWLTEQFGKWLAVARESYEREQELHEANKELRAMSAAELDRPENRRKVAQQAAAENANANRLDNLNRSGRSLVEQATKNDEFDAKKLESWAAMLKSLTDIAANRMPSVSDLLKQSAGAPGQKPSAAGPPNPSSQPAQTAKAEPPPAGAKAGESKSAPNITHGEASPPAQKPPSALDPSAQPKPPTPSIADREAGFGKPPETKPPQPDAKPKPPSSGQLGLPSTELAAAPSKKGGHDAQKPESPAQQKLGSAITEQKELLAEFAKVSDQLSDILAGLEASTFVKRFKAASRKQMGLATTIAQKTLDAFGIERKPVEAAGAIAKTAIEESESVNVIESDLDAYFQRKQDNRFKRILDEMRKTGVVHALAGGGEKVSINLTGQALVGSEFWADTLDRWSEELVSASNGKSSSSNGSNDKNDSLPPEIILKVMQALRDEMKLRDETRETENARPAVAPEKFTADAKALSDKQTRTGALTQSAMSDITSLPEGGTKFGKELKLLDTVIHVMDEAEDILDAPETGPKAIAAETDAIELLLQAKRQSPNGGGSGGSNPGGGGTAASASSAALSELGPGSDAQSTITARPVGQATGRAGREFPDELKAGLETYFNLLEGGPAAK